MCDGGGVCAWLKQLECMEEDKLYVGRGILNINTEGESTKCVRYSCNIVLVSDSCMELVRVIHYWK